MNASTETDYGREGGGGELVCEGGEDGGADSQ